MTNLPKVEYLYGINVNTKVWETMHYKEVLLLKCKLAHNRIGVINESHYMIKDSQNINECVTAIKFNEKLLLELKRK